MSFYSQISVSYLGYWYLSRCYFVIYGGCIGCRLRVLAETPRQMLPVCTNSTFESDLTDGASRLPAGVYFCKHRYQRRRIALRYGPAVIQCRARSDGSNSRTPVNLASTSVSLNAGNGLTRTSLFTHHLSTTPDAELRTR